MTLCFYFGCWNEAGHFLHAPDGKRVHGYNDVDGMYSPRRLMRRPYSLRNVPIAVGALCWAGQGNGNDERREIDSCSAEFPQGQFLHLSTGFTAIAWWDRTQGDTRGGSSSTIFLQGKRTADEMLVAAREHFPRVLDNLARAGVQLVEVQR